MMGLKQFEKIQKLVEVKTSAKSLPLTISPAQYVWGYSLVCIFCTHVDVNSKNQNDSQIMRMIGTHYI